MVKQGVCVDMPIFLYSVLLTRNRPTIILRGGGGRAGLCNYEHYFIGSNIEAVIYPHSPLRCSYTE